RRASTTAPVVQSTPPPITIITSVILFDLFRDLYEGSPKIPALKHRFGRFCPENLIGQIRHAVEGRGGSGVAPCLFERRVGAAGGFSEVSWEEGVFDLVAHSPELLLNSTTARRQTSHRHPSLNILIVPCRRTFETFLATGFFTCFVRLRAHHSLR